VGIIGAGPAGLLLSHLLHLQGIESVVLEARDAKYVQHRVRAGVLEHGTVELLREVGLGKRLDELALRHEGIELRFDRRGHRIDFLELTGRTVTVYGQQEVVKDLIAARISAGGDVRFEIDAVTLDRLDGDTPRMRFRQADTERVLDCDFIVGCDGFHGISRPTIPADVLRIYERLYPFAWLGVLAEAPPSSDELIYAHSNRGFALHSMRSPTVTRQYLQVTPDEDIKAWPDDRIWSELALRFADDTGFVLTKGAIFEKGVTPMRSFVVEPMQYGRLYLAGDAAHIVPPTGAKGLNLAVADVRLLSRGLAAFYADGRTDLLAEYSATALRRVWRVTHFSWWMTSMLHRFDAGAEFDERLQHAQLDYVVSSRAMATSLAENYTGLPFDASWCYR